MKVSIRKALVSYLFQWNPDMTKRELTDTITEVISWLMYYFRMFIGEEEFSAENE